MEDFPEAELESIEAWDWYCIHLSAHQQACRWPELTRLTASHISPQEEAPKLRYLHLAAVTRADALLNVLSMDLLALEELHVSPCCPDEWASRPYLAANLVFEGLWPALENLSLQEQGLDLHTMVPVMHTRWAQLQELEWSSNFLDAESIDCLVACKWPCLTWLSRAENKLDASAIQALITGDWPLLQGLCCA